jgi:hypothetical protein
MSEGQKIIDDYKKMEKANPDIRKLFTTFGLVPLTKGGVPVTTKKDKK